MGRLVIYRSDWCGACHTEVPKMVEAARALGITPEIVDVDRCPVNRQAECSEVSWVPTAMLDGVEVTTRELQDRASKGE